MICNNKLRKQEVAEDILEVGLTHSRGVAGIITREKILHSKGLASIRKGKGTHGTTTESRKLWKQN